MLYVLKISDFTSHRLLIASLQQRIIIIFDLFLLIGKRLKINLSNHLGTIWEIVYSLFASCILTIKT